MAYTTNEKLPRLRAEAVKMVRLGKSTREVARYFGYNQSTIARWCNKASKTWEAKEIPTLSSRPKTSPRELDRMIVGKIIALRLETKRCAEVVFEYLKREGVAVSLSTVKRKLSRFGLLKKKSPWKRRRMYPIRPGIEKQGDLVELDTIHFVDKHGRRFYIYTGIDVFSRYGFAWASPKSSCGKTLLFLSKAREYFPFDIKCIQTDNGPEFGRWFSDHCKTIHRHNHPRSPNENGHLERFNRTLQEEPQKFGWSIHNPKSLSKYLKYYNNKRLHMGINLKTPAEMMI